MLWCQKLPKKITSKKKKNVPAFLFPLPFQKYSLSHPIWLNSWTVTQKPNWNPVSMLLFLTEKKDDILNFIRKCKLCKMAVCLKNVRTLRKYLWKGEDNIFLFVVLQHYKEACRAGWSSAKQGDSLFTPASIQDVYGSRRCVSTHSFSWVVRMEIWELYFVPSVWNLKCCEQLEACVIMTVRLLKKFS